MFVHEIEVERPGFKSTRSKFKNVYGWKWQPMDIVAHVADLLVAIIMFTYR